MNYAFFILLQAKPAWLAVSRQQRRELVNQHLGPILQAHTGLLTMRYFDAEAFTAHCSDVMLTQTQDPKHHYFFMEQLRDTPLINVPYFEVAQIIPTIEDGYQTFEQSAHSGV